MIMEYDVNKRIIKLNRKINQLDRFALDFTKIVAKHTDYIIISGYISILLGRARATEDIDMFIKKLPIDKFFELFKELKENEFWCLNAEEPDEIYNYLMGSLPVRFARINQAIPNFELKWSENRIDSEIFSDFIIAILPEGELRISSLERHIAFKRYYLKSKKDIEDAIHVEELFNDKLDKEKINKLKKLIEEL